MKILQINAVYDIGSTGRIACEMAKGIESYGHECYIAYSSGKSTEYAKSYKMGSTLGKKIHAGLSRIFGRQGFYSSFSTKKLIRYIEKEQFDIIHLGNLHSNYINIKLLLKYLADNNVPVVLTLHDCWFYTGRCYHYTIEQCLKWQICCHDCPRLQKDTPSWFFDFSKNMYEIKKKLFGSISHLAVVGVSQWITQEASKSFLQSSSMIECIYNWIDTEVFRPRAEEEIINTREKYGVGSKFMILSAAVGWSQSKGLERLLELSSMLKEDEILVLAGQVIDKTILPDNVMSVGYIDDVNELVRLYSAADCYISMSLEESFGLVVAEAQACGTPAVVYS